MLIRRALLCDVEAIAEIHTASWAECYDFIPSEVHEARNLEVRLEQWSRVVLRPMRDELLLAVCLNGSVEGFAYCKANDDVGIEADGELTAAYFRPAMRGGKSGPRVMRVMLEHFRALGFSSASIWVFDENPVRRWYRALGWRLSVNRDRMIAGCAVPESGLICDDLPAMITRLTKICERADEI